MSSIQSVLLIAVATPLFYALWRKYVSRRNAPLPPGPKGYPVIGNIYDIPHDRAWLKYMEWGKQYGDVIYMSAFGTHTIVLNSLQAATELLEKRSANSADRPDMIMANELMEWSWDFAHMRHSEWWRRHRKMFHQYFQPRAVITYQQLQLKATGNLLRKFLDNPDQFISHVRHHSGSIILWLIYGYEIQPENDYYVGLVQEALKGLGMAAHAGNFLVEYLPFLKYIPEWFPGAGFQKIAKKYAIATNNLRNLPFETVKKAMADGTAIPSFVTEKLNSSTSENTGEYEEIVKNCAGIAYMAGSDSIVSVILTWMLAMIHNPNAFARAQEEMDSFVGKSRLPNFQDRESLPYIGAMLSETLRWYPVTPQALPHRATHEDIYKGYHIPEGATLVPNVWAILHDETLYPESDKFKPERFLKQNGKELPPDPVVAGAFGFGRRICSGRHFALNTVWITIASIVACFNISKPLNSDGKLLDLPIKYTDGLVVRPEPFPIKLVPRSPEAIHLINSTKE